MEAMLTVKIATSVDFYYFVNCFEKIYEELLSYDGILREVYISGPLENIEIVKNEFEEWLKVRYIKHEIRLTQF